MEQKETTLTRSSTQSPAGTARAAANPKGFMRRVALFSTFKNAAAAK